MGNCGSNDAKPLAEQEDIETHVAKEQATDAATAVTAAVENAVEAVAEAAGLVKDEAEEDQGTAAQVEDAAKLVTETVISTIDAAMDAAVAAVTGRVVVDFGGAKGPEKQVEFQTQKIGLELGLSRGGCCAPKGQAKVVVKKLAKGGQAEGLGVKLGMTMKSINGVEVTGLEHAKKLLAEHMVKLPQA